MKGLIDVSCKFWRGSKRTVAVVIKVMEQFQNEMKKTMSFSFVFLGRKGLKYY